MIKLLIILLLTSQIFAAQVKEDFTISGKIMTYYSTKNIGVSNDTIENDIVLYGATQLNIDYDKNNFHFQATPYIYKYQTESGHAIKAPGMTEAYSEQKFFFRSLYLSYTYENWTFGGGIIPFSNSVPMKYSDNSIQDGVGLNTLNDNDLTALFLTYKTENSETIIGIGSMDELIAPTGEYISEALKEDTVLYFIINTYTNDKWTFTNELFYVDMKYEKEDLSEIYLYGFGTSWDDSAESGLVVYNVFGASMCKNNSINAKEAIYNNVFSDNPHGLDGLTYGNMVEDKYPDSFAMNNETYYGASNLLGLRYEMDVFPLETFINLEWFHTMGDWSSGNQGNTYNGKINQMYNIRDNSYYINYGILTSKNSLLKLSYTYLEFEEFGKIGAPASTVASEDFLGGKPVRTTVEAIHITFTYRF